jgi:hypothetical protein
MAYMVWLGIMGLVVGGIAAFLVARIDSEGGPSGEKRNMVFVAGMTLLGGVVFTVLTGWVGHLLFGESVAPIVGLIGGLIAVGIIYVMSVRSTQGRANRGRGLAPTRPPEGEAATKTPTPR